jgi:hypothetical protein
MTMNDTTTTPDTTTTATPAPTAADPRAEALKQLQRGLRDLLARIEQVHETARHDEFEIGCEIDGNDRVLLEHNGEELSGALTEISDELDGVESDLEDAQGWLEALATAPAPAPATTITLEQARAIHRRGWLQALATMRDARFAMEEEEASGPALTLNYNAAWYEVTRWPHIREELGLPPLG